MEQTLPGRSTNRWASLASFGISTFYVSLLLWLTVWVVLPTALLRWQPMLVTSGSMAPLIRSGDVVLIGDHDGNDLAPGTVVTFHDRSRDGELVTHRISALREDGTYTTKGDANAAVDAAAVHPDDIAGVGRLLVPMIGLPLTWLHDGGIVLFAVWAIATLLALLVAARPPADGDADQPGTDGDRPQDDAVEDEPVPVAAGAMTATRSTTATVTGSIAAPVADSTATATGSTGTPVAHPTAGAPEPAVRRTGAPRRPAGPRHGGWHRPRRATLSLVLGVALAAVLVPRTHAAFTATGTNPGSSFQAASAAAAPTGLTVTDCGSQGGNRYASLSWTAPSPAPDSYRLEQADGSPAGFTTVTTTTGTSHTVNGLTNNVPTYFRVVSLTGSWESAPSATVSVLVRGANCTTPAP